MTKLPRPRLKDWIAAVGWLAFCIALPLVTGAGAEIAKGVFHVRW